ncbi:MAG: hypothetical protein ACR2NF_12295 [Pirellulales bacterium]
MTSEQVAVCIAEMERRWIEKTNNRETLRLDEILPTFRVPASEMRRFAEDNDICKGSDLFCMKWKEAAEKLYRKLKRKYPNESW